MTQTFRQVPGHPGKYEPHNPGWPLWRILLCKAVSFLYDVVCRPLKTEE